MSNQLSRPRGVVSIADALIALDGLSQREREKAWQWLPELTGMERPGVDRPIASASMGTAEAFEPTLPTDRETTRWGQPEEEPSGTGGPTQQDRQAQDRYYSPTLPGRLVAKDTRDPDWLTETQGGLGEVKPFQLGDLPALQPLFEPGRTRSVLSSALATPKPDGALDINALLDAVARRRAITRLPRLTIATTRLGLQLLLDRSDAMLPYRRDQMVLAKSIRDTVGGERVEELRFDGLPENGIGRGRRSTWRKVHRSPPAGTPVVVLTDLGIGAARAGNAEETDGAWREFARRQRRAGCPVLAVVPYVPARVPSTLRECFHILPWSRTTTVATVRQWIGRGLMSSQ
ncbi:MAG: hypothetical protein LJE70_12090 [Chromatiaceae bacterium]|nr:hypothetical protein [Chromatiaceae bacterium]